ncbi:MAG: hypothetical protein D6740_00415 [Alphaproteobacteria bacterium]|nr:MAG: hypothetical protein D6740_00415 [Alphaproteobacteria bacterium]
MKLSHAAIFSALLATSCLVAPPALAQNAGDQGALLSRIEKLEAELRALKAELAKSKAKAEEAAQKAETAEAKASQAVAKAEAPAATQGGGSVLSGGLFTYRAGDVRFHLGGYGGGNVEFVDNGENSTFADVNFNPIFLVQYKDWLLFESELEFETTEGEGTKLELEYAALDLMLGDNATLVFGKYLSPIGIFQERLHPKWINKVISRPPGFDGIVEPLTDVGLQLRGGIPLGDDMKLTYVFMLGNGPQVEEEGQPALEGFGEDDNDNKAVGGRISFFPVPWLELGGSAYHAKVSGVEELTGEADVDETGFNIRPAGLTTAELEPTNADLRILGAHAVATYKDLDLRFEYLNSKRDAFVSVGEPGELPELLPTQKTEAWYAQAAYKLAGLTSEDIVKDLELVARFGQLNVKKGILFRDDAQDRLTLGVNYLLAPNIVIKFNYERRNFDEPDLKTENRFMGQFAIGF